MNVVLDRPPAPPTPPPTERTGSPRRHGLVAASTVAAGLALVVFVGADGSAGWRFVRVATVVLLTAAAVVAEVRLGDRGCGRLAAVVGVVAVAVGVGFLPHLAKSGLTLASAAAAVEVVSGLVLLVAGMALATLGRRLPFRIGAGVIAVLAAAVATFVAAPAIAATNVPPIDLGPTPASVGLDASSVTLTTADGVRLAAWYVPSTNGAAVVLRHGAGSTRSSVLEQAAVLAAHGFGVLMVDARGHGASGGRAMEFGWYGDADIEAAIGFLGGRSDVDPRRIGLVGLSMGGEEAVGAAATNELVRAVVAEGATGRTAADEAWLSDEFGMRGTLSRGVEWLRYGLADLLTDASPPVSLRSAVAASAGTRFLLIAAGEMPDEADAAAYIAGGAPDRVDTWIVPGAGHTAGLATDPHEWEGRVVGFLTDALGLRSGPSALAGAAQEGEADAGG